MKKLSILMITFFSVLCLSSCQKDDSKNGNSDAIETSYWKAVLNNGESFYVAIEEITAEDKEDAPIPFNDKYTNLLMAEIDGYSSVGFAYRDNNHIQVVSLFEFGRRFPETYDYNGTMLSCEYDGEYAAFIKISEEQFYDSVICFEKE